MYILHAIIYANRLLPGTDDAQQPPQSQAPSQGWQHAQASQAQQPLVQDETKSRFHAIWFLLAWRFERLWLKGFVSLFQSSVCEVRLSAAVASRTARLDGRSVCQWWISTKGAVSFFRMFNLTFIGAYPSSDFLTFGLV